MALRIRLGQLALGMLLVALAACPEPAPPGATDGGEMPTVDLAEGEVGPALAGPATPLEARLTVRGDIDGDPSFRLGPDGDPSAWMLTGSEVEGQVSTFFATRAPEVDDPEDVAIPVQAEVRWANGTQTTVVLGEVRFDYTAPTLRSPRWHLPSPQTAARPDQSIRFTAVTDLGTSLHRAEVRDSGGDIVATLSREVTFSEGLDPNTLLVSGVLDLSTLSLPETETLELAMVVRDEAGNTSAPVSFPPLAVDARVPGPVSVTIAEAPLTAFAEIDLDIAASNTSEIYLEGDLLPGPGFFEWRAVPEVPVAATLAGDDGAKIVRVRARGPTGLEASAEASIVLDRSSTPTFSRIEVMPRALADTDTATLTLEVQSIYDLSAAPAVQVGSRAAALLPGSVDLGAGIRTFTYRFVADQSLDPEGELPVAVSVEDVNGEVTIGDGGLVRMDFTPPALTGFDWEPTATSGIAQLDERLTVRAEAGDDAVLSGAWLEDQNGTVLADVMTDISLVPRTPADGKADLLATLDLASFDLTVVAGIQLRVALADDLGNAVPKSAATTSVLTLDHSGPPNISAVSVSPSFAIPGDTLTITFTVSDDFDLPARPLVRVGGRDATWIAGALATSTGAQMWTWRFTVDPALDVDGVNTVFLSVEDIAGDRTLVLPAPQVTFDFTGKGTPSISGVTVQPLLARDGQTVSVAFTVDDDFDLPGRPLVQIGGRDADWVSGQPTTSLGPQSWTWQFVADSNLDAEGLNPVRIEVTDLAGNLVTVSPQPEVTFDFTGPGPSGLAWDLPGWQTAARSDETLVARAVVADDAMVVDATLESNAWQPLGNLLTETTLTPRVPADGYADLTATIDLSTLDLTGATGVVYSVTLTDPAGNTTSPAPARTITLPLDDALPGSPLLTVAEAPATGTVDVTLTVTATGATEVYLDGDLADAANVRTWMPYPVSTVGAKLTPGDGNKTLRASFRDGAGNVALAPDVTLLLDAGAVVSSPTVALPAGQTAIKNGDLLTVGGSAEAGSTLVSAALVDLGRCDGAGVCVVVQDVTSDVRVEADGTLGGGFLTAGLSDGLQVALEVIVSARGFTSVPAGSRSGGVLVALQIPSAPTKSRIRLRRTHPAPGDPTRVGLADQAFRFTGLSGAAPGDGKIRFYRSGNQVAETAASNDGSFPETVLSGDPYEWNASAVGPSGLESATKTFLTSPEPVVGQLKTLYAAGALVRGSVTGVPMVTGSATICGHPMVCTNYSSAVSCDHTAVGDEAEGYDSCVARFEIELDPTYWGYASGSTITVADTAGFDFTPPVVDASLITLVPQASPDRDYLSVLPGAVSDNVDVGRYRALEGGVTLVDGFANNTRYYLSDNLFKATVELIIDDSVGNSSAPVYFDIDNTPPIIRDLFISPTTVRSGQTVSISFQVDQGQTDLSATPKVTAASTDATQVSGSLSTSTGNQVLVFEVTADATVMGSGDTIVLAEVEDFGMNRAKIQGWFFIDDVVPTCALSSPAHGSTWGGGAMFGSCEDDVAMGSVDIALLDTLSGLYWDGTAFAGLSPTWLTPSGVSPWSLDTSGVAFVDGADYRIDVRGIDSVGNSGPVESASFTVDSSIVAGPTDLTAVSTGAQTVALAWSEPGYPVDYYRVYYVEQSVGPPFNGIGADQGPSGFGDVATLPGGTTSLEVTGLARDRWTFVVTAVQPGGAESAPSNQATAASRAWARVLEVVPAVAYTKIIATGTDHFVGLAPDLIQTTHDAGTTWSSTPGPVGLTLRDVGAANGAVVAVGDGGTIMRSVDDGLTWQSVAGGVTEDLHVVVSEGTTVVAAGNGGLVLHSADAGATWTATATGLSSDFRYADLDGGVAFVAPRYGYSIASPDAGSSWSTVRSHGSEVKSVAVSGGALFYYAGGLYRSTDFGGTWDYYYSSGLKAAVRVGSSFVLWRRTGAEDVFSELDVSSWTEQTPVVSPIGTPDSIVASGGHLLAWNRNRAVVDPLSGGGLVSPVTRDMWHMAYDGTQIVASGYYRWRPASTTWEATATPADHSFAGLAAKGATVVGVERFGLVHRSDDGGATWRRVTGLESLALAQPSWDGGRLSALTTGLLTSFDDGRTWPYNAFCDCSPEFAYSGGGISLVTDYGTVCVSRDGGRTLEEIPELAYLSTTAIGGVDDIVFLGLDNGDIIRTDDGFLTWTRLPSVATSAIRAFYVEPGLALASGDRGPMYRSTDGGLNWTTQPLNAGSRIMAIDVDGSNAVAVSFSGGLINSTDGGVTWTITAVDSTSNLGAVAISGNHAVAAGAMVYESFDGGVTWALVPGVTIAGTIYSRLSWRDADVVALGDGAFVLGAKDSNFYQYGPL